MGCAASATTTGSFSRAIPSDEAPCISRIGSPGQSRPETEGPSLRGEQEAESHRRALQSLKIALRISREDQVDFDDSELDLYKPPRQPAPRNQFLPPGRPEHVANTRRVARFCHAAARHPNFFGQIVGRGLAEEE